MVDRFEQQKGNVKFETNYIYNSQRIDLMIVY